MNKALPSTIIALAFLLLLSPATILAVSSAPLDAAEVRPLLVGAQVPDVTLTLANGEPLGLRDAVHKQPTVLLFYRGGWCPYCNRHLAAVGEVESELRELGFRILAVSPDQPSEVAKAVGEQEVNYTLASDSKMTAAQAFGIAFKVDDDTVNLYLTEYNLDLEKYSGETHHQLPAPAAFILGEDGTIKFAHVDPEYRVRLAPEVILSAARAAAATD